MGAVEDMDLHRVRQTHALEKGKVDGHFWTDFYARHKGFLTERVPCDEDLRRAQAANEIMVDIHLEGENGVRKTLMKWGIMDESGVITPANTARVLNMDEMPQFLDYGMNAGNTNCQVMCLQDTRMHPETHQRAITPHHEIEPATKEGQIHPRILRMMSMGCLALRCKKGPYTSALFFNKMQPSHY